MIVYRIQDQDGRGPWKPGFSHFWVEDRDDHDALKPYWQQLGHVQLQGTHDGMHLGCGCKTIEQLRRWFNPTEYARLLRYGYQAVRIEADRILGESDIQVVFERAAPLRLSAEPFNLYASFEVSA